jgi:hypothetical protein
LHINFHLRSEKPLRIPNSTGFAKNFII